MSNIIGTLQAKHTVDPNGSLNIDVPIQLPPSNLDPGISFSYHSAAQDMGDMGPGWVIKGLAIIERTGATKEQDGFLGSVNYDANDRFTLNGSRIISIGNGQYRYEVEQWSEIVASGSDQSNPDYWTEYLPDGSYRIFGNTIESNIKAQGSATATRVWAVCKYADAFSNHISYTYSNEKDSGAYYINSINYGGNESLSIQHQRIVTFSYELRPDVFTRFVGGHKIYSDKRLVSMSTSVNGNKVHTHTVKYALAPLTARSRVQSITMSDASGAAVNPVVFDWNDAAPEVYQPIKDLNKITPGVNDPQMIPMDFDANGKTDMVVASAQLNNGIEALYLDVYLSDGSSNLSHSSTCSGTTGLDSPTQLLGISANDYGRADLLHILKVDNDENGKQAHVMTVLLSTDSGFEPQSSYSFIPEVFDGKYFTGDFNGDGRVGLIYVYNSLDQNAHPVLRITQLALTGTQFKAISTIDIPGGMNLSDVQVVIADFNGDGADDAYFIWSEVGDSIAHIHLVQSMPGNLKYVGEVLDGASKPIEWFDDIGFTTHDVGDGLVGLLAVSNDIRGEIQLQAIRSTGKTLLALSAPQPTGIVYNGRVSQARTTSTDTSDIVIMSHDDSNRTVHIDVLRYNADTFQRVSNVQQPTAAQYGYMLSNVDLRGTGRADCLFSIVDFEGNISLSTLETAGSHTADILSGYTNGLGAKTSVAFAPLTDSTIYTTTEASGASPTAYTNALARNVTSSVSVAAAGGLAQTDAPSRSRTMLVHYPKYVVKEISAWAAPTKVPNVASTVSYQYKNARFAPDGRGWLGFESVTQMNKPEGTRITSSFMQDFPFLGQTSSIVITDTSGIPLTSTSYSWAASSPTNGNKSVELASQVQSRYEGGSHAFDVTTQYQYDRYTNITKQTTTLSDSGRPTCTITNTYINDEGAWVLGRPTLRAVDPGDGAIAQTKFEFQGNAPAPNAVSKLIGGTSWSTQTFTYDAAGKETSVCGPGPAKATFTYDRTNSFRASETFQTGPSSSYTNTCSYEYVTGQVSSVRDANGHITEMAYDILGRPLTISEGNSTTSMAVMQKFKYTSDSNGAYHRNDTRTSWDSDEWGFEIVYTDGLNQEWRKVTNSPEDPNISLVQDMVFDGAGRVTQQSRTYRSGEIPVFATCTFDAQSRPLSKTSPSLNPNVKPVTIAYEYSYSNQRAQVTERQYDSSSTSPSQVSVKHLQYFPNTEPDSGHELVKPLVVKQVDAMSRSIDITFDGLLRATSATDPAGVQLSVTWDGLSRQTERLISNGPQPISHFSMSYDDDKCQSTLTNNLTNSAAVTTYDYAKRPINRTSGDETVDLSYDANGSNVISRLASVKSSTGVQHSYSYDSRGNLADITIGIDGHSFKTSYEWTPTKKVARTVNPDGTSVARSFFEGTSFIRNMNILSSSHDMLLATAFSKFNNATFRPNVCTLGNGLTSTVTTADNGALTSSTLQDASNILHSQNWTLDSFSKIQQYNKACDSQTLTSNFTYDAGGQILASKSSGTSAEFARTFTYDDSGNLSSQDTDVWMSKGWQLSSIKDASGNLTSTFNYSPDGNLTEKMDGTGETKMTMSYDSDGRLTNVNNASFVYDYQGRVLKATHSDGSITYYPNPEYDVLVKPSGDVTNTAHVINGWRRGFVSTDTIGGTVQAPSARYLQTDHLGSIVAVMDSAGSVLTTYEYDAYGHTTVSGKDISRYKYGGNEEFEGLYYFGARFYDPQLRRFITLDNITVTLENITPQSFNQYTYSRNDPVNYVDVNGNVPWWHWLVGAALVVVGVVITIATGGAASPLIFYGGAAIGGAILGAGTSALQSDLMAEVYNNGQIDDGEWLKSMGIGAAIGAVTGLAGGAFNKIIAPRLGGAILDRVATSTSKLFSYSKPFTKWAGTTIAQLGLRTGQRTGLSALTAFGKSFVIHEALSITVGVSSQLIKNAVAGRAWDYHLTGILWVSAVTGLGNAVASGFTAGILKGVGNEVVAHSGKGLHVMDALTETGRTILNDARFAARLWGLDVASSSLNKL